MLACSSVWVTGNDVGLRLLDVGLEGGAGKQGIARLEWGTLDSPLSPPPHPFCFQDQYDDIVVHSGRSQHRSPPAPASRPLPADPDHPELPDAPGE